MSRDKSFGKSNPKKGRPPRDPIETVRTQTFIKVIAKNSTTRCIGTELEKKFCGEFKRNDANIIQRSCKYDRYVTGEKTPSKDTRFGEIYPHCSTPKSIESMFNSPLWLVCRSKPLTDKEWMTFYQAMPLNLQHKIFKNHLRSESNNITHKSIQYISQQVNLNSLALLIALLRDPKLKICVFELDTIEWEIYRSIISLSVDDWLMDSSGNLYEYISQHIIHSKSHENRMKNIRLFFPKDTQVNWNQSKDDFESLTNVFASLIIRSEDLYILRPYTKQVYNAFKYWLLRSDINTVFDEIENAKKCKVGQYKTLEADKGLRWLITQLNKIRPKALQLPIDRV